jgi:hypothetical protein
MTFELASEQTRPNRNKLSKKGIERLEEYVDRGLRCESGEEEGKSIIPDDRAFLYHLLYRFLYHKSHFLASGGVLL